MNRLPSLTAALLLSVSSAAFADASLINKAPAPAPVPSYTNILGQGAPVATSGARAGEKVMNEQTSVGLEYSTNQYVAFRIRGGRNVLSKTMFARVTSVVVDATYKPLGVKILGPNGLQFIPNEKLSAKDVIYPSQLLETIAKAKSEGQLVDIAPSTVAAMIMSPKPSEQHLLTDLTKSVLEQNNSSATTFVRDASRYEALSEGLPEFRASLSRTRAIEFAPRPTLESVVRDAVPAATK